MRFVLPLNIYTRSGRGGRILAATAVFLSFTSEGSRYTYRLSRMSAMPEDINF